jgi:hypothetical protein
MKNVVSVVRSTAWEESYYRESIRALAAKQGIPRMAEFPADQVEWEKNTSRMEKFGLESDISFEDVQTNRIDVVARTLTRIANRVTSLVDTQIWKIVSNYVTSVPGDGGAVHTNACSAEWNNATRANRIPHEDIAEAAALIADSELQAYKADTILVNPTDYIYLITNDYIMDSYDASGPALMRSGNMGTLFGMNLIVSPVVTDDYAAVIQSKICGTWKSASDLRTVTIREEGKKYTVRAYEIGCCQLTDPKAVCVLTNTHV